MVLYSFRASAKWKIGTVKQVWASGCMQHGRLRARDSVVRPVEKRGMIRVIGVQYSQISPNGVRELLSSQLPPELLPFTLAQRPVVCGRRFILKLRYLLFKWYLNASTFNVWHRAKSFATLHNWCYSVDISVWPFKEGLDSDYICLEKTCVGYWTFIPRIFLTVQLLVE